MKINDLSESINKGVYNYLKKNIGIESANSEVSKDLVGKAIVEGFFCYQNSEENLITITYCVFRNQWGILVMKKKLMQIQLLLINIIILIKNNKN